MAEMGNLQRAADAVKFAGEVIVVFLCLEIGKHVPIGPGAVIGPGWGDQLVPTVEISRLPSHVDHGIDRAAATQDLALGDDRPAAIQLRLGLGLVHRKIGVLCQELHIARWKMHDRICLCRATLKQQHTCLAFGDQPRSDHACRTAASNDNKVEPTVVGHWNAP